MKSPPALRRELEKLRGVIAIRRFNNKPTISLDAAEWTLRWVLNHYGRSARPSKAYSDQAEFDLMERLRK